ncbi:MAG TPA: hypothetical protein VFA83_18250 [Acidimicrobiales bacterium]|nr:hypothetical protein [Acidimicrobiales bacterium]
MRRKERRDEEAGEMPVGLWEFLQPYVLEEEAPSLEWAVRRSVDSADDRPSRIRVVPAPAPAS